MSESAVIEKVPHAFTSTNTELSAPTHNRRRKVQITPATCFSILALLISFATAAFVIYLYFYINRHLAIIDLKGERERAAVIDVVFDKTERINGRLDLIGKVIQELVIKLVGRDGAQSRKRSTFSEVVSRKKREAGNDKRQKPNEEAEEDLSQLSLTGLSFLRGPPGFPGRDGRDGPQGATGGSGPAGASGPRGEKGENGDRGTPGQSGLNGRDGQQGVIGPRGERGAAGQAGLAGRPGADGSRGSPGEAGRRGPPGAAGPPGPAGPSGARGSPGSSARVIPTATATASSATTTAPDSQHLEQNNTHAELVAEIKKLKESVTQLEIIDAKAGAKSKLCPEWTRGATMSQTLIGDVCYVLVNQLKSHTAAKRFCQQQGYNLVSFQTYSKQRLVENWLRNILNRLASKEVWTSGYRKSGRPVTEWFWGKTGGDVLIRDYTDWSFTEPQSSDYCIASRYLLWYGRQCGGRYDFICEGPPAITRAQLQKSGGTVYTRWGRKQCSNSSVLVYAGLVGGAQHSTVGGGVNYQCLPPNPELNTYNVMATDVSWIRSVEYESQSYKLFSDVIDNKHAVCARCYTQNRPALMMIPAKVSCPEDWVKEYSGFLMAGKEDELHPTTYECVDRNPEFEGLASPDYGGRMWFVNVDCRQSGSVGQCSKYRHGRQMTCVVCSR